MAHGTSDGQVVTNHGRASLRTTGTGIAASALALLCCAGAGPVIGVLSAVGLGFLLRDAILIPALVGALALTVRGLWQERRCHARTGPLATGIVGSSITLVGVFAWVPLAFGGLATVVIASIWNVVAIRACALPRPASS